MTKDEALRLALEALESTGENNGYHGVTQYFDEAIVDQAITAIKAALEAKDEPVAWMYDWTTSEGEFIQDWTTSEAETLRDTEPTIITNVRPLYTTPPQRTWVWLTNEEHMQLAEEWGCLSADWVFYAAAVERKIKERNT